MDNGFHHEMLHTIVHGVAFLGISTRLLDN